MSNAPRFFHPTALKTGDTIQLPESIAHYAVRVLRLKSNSKIILFNGNGGQYIASLIIENKNAYANILEHDNIELELLGTVNLIQGLPSGSKMDLIAEKAVELGAASLWPVASKHSVTQLHGQRLEKRIAHWQRIAQSASEQCGRNRVMQVNTLCKLDAVLSELPCSSNALTLLCHHEGGSPFNKVVLEQAHLWHGKKTEQLTVNLLVGPEGGWSDEEVALAQQHGAKVVLFGNRIMRTETAGIALIAACTALLDWSG